MLRFTCIYRILRVPIHRILRLYNIYHVSKMTRRIYLQIINNNPHTQLVWLNKSLHLLFWSGMTERRSYKRILKKVNLYVNKVLQS